MVDAIKVGKDVLDRTMPFENGSVLNPVGMINVVDSMAAIKKLVFEDKKVTKKGTERGIRRKLAGREIPGNPKNVPGST